MELGGLRVPAGAVFAPMAGFTDAACRRLMADHGAAWTVSEMISAKALTYGDKKSRRLLADRDPHALYGVQLFGSVPEEMEQAAALIRGERFDFYDINMGCPAPKITSGGAGSRLMLDPALCGRLVAAVVRAADGRPVTVKIRSGWDHEHITAVEVARAAEQAGAAAVVVHARTRDEMYAPGIDPGVIRAVKQAVGIPVIGNGDVTTAGAAMALMSATGCDTVAVGRGALGNPWLFAQIKAAMEGRAIPPEPTLEQRMQAMRRQIRDMCEEKGEATAMPQARGQALHYMKGLRGAASLRRACTGLAELSDVDRLIELAVQAQQTE